MPDRSPDKNAHPSQIRSFALHLVVCAVGGYFAVIARYREAQHADFC
jgi:hypothetical protein